MEALHITGLLIAPRKLGSVVAKKCNLLHTSHVLYDGELWLYDEEDTLAPERFEYLEGKATIVVTGELTIAPEVSPESLRDKIVALHNYGEIVCTSAQRAILQSRLVVNQGELVDDLSSDAGEEGIGNAAYFQL